MPTLRGEARREREALEQPPVQTSSNCERERREEGIKGERETCGREGGRRGGWKREVCGHVTEVV